MTSLSIWYPPFDYAVLWQAKPALIAYFAIVVCILSFYFIQNFIVRAVLFFATLGLALFADRITFFAGPFILIYLFVYYYALNAKRMFWQNSAFIVLLVLSVAMIFVPVPGINNWLVVNKWQITSNAIPYSMKFTFDKSLIGLLFIWFSAQTLANQKGWALTIKTGLLMGSLAVCILIPLSFALGYVQVDLKLTHFTYLWLINNLFFVCLAEEALFRGLIQRFLVNIFQFKHGQWLALFISASLFGLAHFQGGIKYVLLATIAGICYGYAFLRTKRIEASILTHFMVNTVHFLAFTYPALKSAF